MWITRLFSTALALTLLSGTHDQAHACWAAPPEIEWEQTADQRFELRIENRTGVVTVFAVGDRENPIWSARPADFDGLFSRVYLVHDGELLVHVQGNHRVGSIDDVGVELLHRDGTREALPVHTFVQELLPGHTEIRLPDGQVRLVFSSISPQWRWLSSVDVVDGEVVITTVADRKHTVTGRAPGVPDPARTERATPFRIRTVGTVRPGAPAAIRFDVPRAETTSVRIFDVAGRRVRSLLDERLDAGAHTVVWDGRTQGGPRVAAGVYFLRIETPQEAASHKILVLPR